MINTFEELEMKQNHKDKFTDAELIAQYQVMPTLSKLSHYFNVPDVTIWRRAKKLGLAFKIGGSTTKFPLSEILEGKHPQYQSNKLKNRLVNEGVKEDKCEVCGITEWQGKPITMQLDHIDGNSHNHLYDNLRLVCPNCHAQTDTWCGKNKKS
jgi:hypothetical protein